MKLFTKIYLTLALLTSFCVEIRAQVRVFGNSSAAKVRAGYTHVVVKQLNFTDSALFREVFKKYWTLPKGIDFITENNLQGHIIKGGTYFSIDLFTWGTSDFLGPRTRFGNLYLDLWTPAPGMLKKQKFDINREVPIGRIALFAGEQATPDDFKLEFGGNCRIYHWNPGYLKNYLQMLDRHLRAGNTSVGNDTLIRNLKIKTLYCPYENFGNGESNSATLKQQIDETFKDYRYTYKLISDKELGDMILNAGHVFYYLLFIPDSYGKTIAVINSQTGEIAYSKYIRPAGRINLTAKDVQNISKAIAKL